MLGSAAPERGSVVALLGAENKVAVGEPQALAAAAATASPPPATSCGDTGVDTPLSRRDTRIDESSGVASRSHKYTSPSSEPPATRPLDGDAKLHRIMFLDVFWCPVYR